MKYDITKLKTEIKAVAAEIREAKKIRRAKWQTYSAVENEDAKLEHGSPARREWYDRLKKALDSAQGATSAAAWPSDRATALCSLRAHLRGRLHMRKRFDATTGKYYGWTMEDQAKLVEERMVDFELAEDVAKPAA